MLSIPLFHHINVFLVVYRQQCISILLDDILSILACGLLASLFLCFLHVIVCRGSFDCGPVLHRELIGIGVGKSQFISSTRLLILSWDVLQLPIRRVVLQLLARLAAAASVLATVVSQDWVGRLIGLLSFINRR